MGWYLDGRVTAVVGTHTHVPTADARVLPGGTAYITDVGMTGPRGGVIGVKREQAIEAMATKMPVRFETSTEDPWLNGGADHDGRASRCGRWRSGSCWIPDRHPLAPPPAPPGDRHGEAMWMRTGAGVGGRARRRRLRRALVAGGWTGDQSDQARGKNQTM